MWTLENRPKYNRDHLRYPSDLTDDEWAYVEPLLPPAKPGGGKRRTDMRAVMNGVMYILSTGCQWRYLPKDFPPRSTVHNYFVWWQCDRVLDRIQKGGLHRSHGFDAGKLIKGKKRHILVDTLGLLLHAIVHSAGIQDRDGGILLLATLFGQFPFLETLFADSAYQGPIFANALVKILPGLETEIVRRSDHAKGFVRLPKGIVPRDVENSRGGRCGLRC